MQNVGLWLCGIHDSKVKLVVAVALHSCDTTADSALVDFDLWFRTKSDRAEDESQFRRTDSDDTIWFVALAKEQLALVTDNRSHWFSFRLRLNKRVEGLCSAERRRKGTSPAGLFHRLMPPCRGRSIYFALGDEIVNALR